MNPCQETSPDIATITDIAKVPVSELDGQHHAKLPIEMRIGLCLMANESLLQQTAFPISQRDALPAAVATELQLDTTDKDVVECVRGAIKKLMDKKYLGFERTELPVAVEGSKYAPEEAWELHLQPVLTPKFDDILHGSVEAAWAEFASGEN